MKEMTLREMVDQFGKTPRTFRFWEQQELITPRREGRKRFYRPREQRRVNLILRYQSLGFALEEIRQKLSENDRDLEITTDEASEKIDQLHVEMSRVEEALNVLEGYAA